MSRSKLVAVVVALAALVAMPASSRAGITPPAGFAVGEWYRLAFVTSGTTKATSGSIATYDAFVQAQAALNPELAPYAADFRAVAYATKSPPPYSDDGPYWGGDYAVFNTRGEQLNSTPNPHAPGAHFISDDAPWLNPLGYDQFGLASHPVGTKVWTGIRTLDQWGNYIFNSSFALGAPLFFVSYGTLGSTTGAQISAGTESGSQLHPLYGFAEIQVLTTAVFDADGGAATVGGAAANFPGLSVTGVLSSTFYEPSTTEQIAQTLAALNAGQSTFILPGAPAQIWDLDFTGAFTGNATVTLSYNPAAVTVGPSLLRIRHWTGEEWVTPKNQVVDGVAHTITFDTESFSPFLLTVVPEPSSVALGVCAAAGLGAVLCRRRRSK